MDDYSDLDHTDKEQPSDSNYSEDYAHSSAFGGPHDTPSPTFATSVTAFSGKHSLSDLFEGEIPLSEQTEEYEDLLAKSLSTMVIRSKITDQRQVATCREPLEVLITLY